jgi:hypothetical protein
MHGTRELTLNFVALFRCSAVQCYAPIKIIGIKIIRSIKREKSSLRLMAHIPSTLKIEGTHIYKIQVKILRLAINNDVKIKNLLVEDFFTC